MYVIITRKLLFCDFKRIQTLWHNLTEFLQTKNITLEIVRLEALICITLGSHCYIFKCINNLKEKIYIFNATEQTYSLFYHFAQL